MQTCRLFFALWPEPAQQVALSQATRHEVERSGGQAVPPQNFHITLVFIGSVPQSDVDRIGSIASQVAEEVGPEPAADCTRFIRTLEEAADCLFDHSTSRERSSLADC